MKKSGVRFAIVFQDDSNHCNVTGADTSNARADEPAPSTAATSIFHPRFEGQGFTLTVLTTRAMSDTFDFRRVV
jgi:hypothetical protein